MLESDTNDICERFLFHITKPDVSVSKPIGLISVVIYSSRVFNKSKQSCCATFRMFFADKGLGLSIPLTPRYSSSFPKVGSIPSSVCRIFPQMVRTPKMTAPLPALHSHCYITALDSFVTGNQEQLNSLSLGIL